MLLHVLRRPLGGDERRAEKRLELHVARDLGLEVVDALGQLGALAPHLLEGVRDVLDGAVHVRAAIAQEPAAQLEMTNFDGCECHDRPSFLRQRRARLTALAR